MPGQGDQPFTGHPEPRLRGVMISTNIDEAGLRTLGQTWNANLIRWQLIRTGAEARKPYTPDAYDAWLETELARLDAALPLCEKYGLRVVIDLHSPPGGQPVAAGAYVGATGTLWTDPATQSHFVDVWKRIATRYKDARPVWAYDLMNEPVDDNTAESCDDWQLLAARAAKTVRAIEPTRAIIIEPPQWGGPHGFIGFDPIDVPGVVYSFHFYEPGQFTHQGIHNNPAGVDYPGTIAGKAWDKSALARAMQPAIDFQKKHNVHLYVGEFSAIRWAPGDSARRYLADCIDLFESHKWDWTYHAFREYHGWSVEHTTDPTNTKPAKDPTPREQLLRTHFRQNQNR